MIVAFLILSVIGHEILNVLFLIDNLSAMMKRVKYLTVKLIITTAIAAGYMVLCSGCYTKKKAIEKFCKSDSVSVIIHDTIRTETITTDTVFSTSLDTVIIKDGKLSIRYIKLRDSIYINGTCEGDTIYLTREVKAPCTIPSISSYSINDWLDGQSFFLQIGFYLILASALLFWGRVIWRWIEGRASK